jgi:hypothetical protein
MATAKPERVTVNGVDIITTSGYMLSVKISTHPATTNGTTVTVYNLTVVAIGQQSVDITLSYLWGVADITSTVSEYFVAVTDPSCTTTVPGDLPTTLTTMNGTACLTFVKLTAYVGDNTFKITASAPDAGNSATTKPF